MPLRPQKNEPGGPALAVRSAVQRPRSHLCNERLGRTDGPESAQQDPHFQKNVGKVLTKERKDNKTK